MHTPKPLARQAADLVTDRGAARAFERRHRDFQDGPRRETLNPTGVVRAAPVPWCVPETSRCTSPLRWSDSALAPSSKVGIGICSSEAVVGKPEVMRATSSRGLRVNPR